MVQPLSPGYRYLRFEWSPAGALMFPPRSPGYRGLRFEWSPAGALMFRPRACVMGLRFVSEVVRGSPGLVTPCVPVRPSLPFFRRPPPH